MSDTDQKKLELLYRRKGHFDHKKHELLEEFKATEAHTKLMASLEKIVADVVEKNPELLTKNIGQVAHLIEGAIIRQNQTGKNTSTLSLPHQIVKKEDINLEGVENVMDIYDSEVQRLTVDNAKLQEEIRATLETLREDGLS